MQFVLEVDLTSGALAADTEAELGRILRYWAGNLKHYQLTAGDNCAIMDSNYTEVGRWHILDTGYNTATSATDTDSSWDTDDEDDDSDDESPPAEETTWS